MASTPPLPEPGALSITSARLILRRLCDSDAGPLFEIFSDEKVMRYWSAPAWRDHDDAMRSIKSHNEPIAKSQLIRLGIERRSVPGVIGVCTLHKIDTQCRRGELGYALNSAFWGQGYMEEALRAFVSEMFRFFSLHRIEADIDPENAASARCLARLGFRLEGHLRERWIVEGKISDSAIYGLLARDWSASCAHAPVQERIA